LQVIAKLDFAEAVLVMRLFFNTEALTFLMVLDKGQPSLEDLTGFNLLESDFDCFGCSSLDSIAAANTKLRSHL
jgi:hypothetical protein